MKKEIEKTKKTYSEDYVGAILEEIRGEFKVFGEQQQFLVEGQKEMRQMLQNLTGRVEKIEIRLDSMDSRLSNFEEKTDKNFKIIFEYLSEIDNEIQSMRSEIEELKITVKNKAESQKVLEMEKRLVKVEKLVFSKMA